VTKFVALFSHLIQIAFLDNTIGLKSRKAGLIECIEQK
jgi:hypothetical protein